ncbi:queuosine precursor transporter [uncultured Tyzzerella sp.]|uniref:queuosine precursor transporter n=1 Tax=uncultured Tyzzerella sp. TaxID=2321398 RepID=UPI002942A757|nr:queuosine precursor transporter [uncultured Tyzzerella sp.]
MISNEVLLILSVFVIYGFVLLWFYLFGNKGLLCFTVFATITANIEVLLVIKAFSLEQTLGNILFGASFLATDILSEFYGKKESKKAVLVGILTSISFVILSQSWLLYDVTNGLDEHFKVLFSNTPRIMIASLVVYAISQFFDVWVYHKWWAFTEKISGDKKRYLWLRNNGSTLISQLINSLLFTLFAFYGTYDMPTLISIFKSSYIIFIITSILDTPAIYIARYLYENKKIKN